MFHEGPSLVAPPCLVLVDICCGRGHKGVLLTGASSATGPGNAGMWRPGHSSQHPKPEDGLTQAHGREGVFTQAPRGGPCTLFCCWGFHSLPSTLNGGEHPSGGCVGLSAHRIGRVKS